MTQSISITVHPSALEVEYLSVADAMRQVLDLVEALEAVEAPGREAGQIVWRLTEAHTNSPPFTVQVTAFPVDPVNAISTIAGQVLTEFSSFTRQILGGRDVEAAADGLAVPMLRVMRRNLNGIGRTVIDIRDQAPLDVVPASARQAAAALERAQLKQSAAQPDDRRTEYGAVEVEVVGVTRWYAKPALDVVERLSRDRVTCVLSAELAARLGPSHQWSEAWIDRRLLVGGALQYGPDGKLQRIDAEDAEELPWADISLADLRGIDILQGRSVSEHIDLIRGDDLG